MKKLIFALALIVTVATLQAQTELKINPIGALFASPDISLEFGVNENIGIEPFIGLSFPSLTVDGTKYKSTGLGYGVHGKYYFGGDKGLDKFYGGIFLRGGNTKFTTSTSSNDKFTRSRLGVGFELGYKWVSSQNIVFELGAGIGRKIYSKYSDASNSVNTANIPLLNLDGFFRFNIGYRFGGGSSSKRN